MVLTVVWRMAWWVWAIHWWPSSGVFKLIQGTDDRILDLMVLVGIEINAQI